MITKAFTPGQTFKTLDDKIATITRRTEKSVWYSIDGVETRRKIQVVCNEEMIHESKNFDVWADHCKAPQTEVIETIQTEVTETETIEVNTVETSEVNPIDAAEYEAIRNALIDSWQECQSKINDEKSAKYDYLAHCKKQGIEPDTTVYDSFIARMRDLAKGYDTKIKSLDMAQGLSDEYYYY